MQSIWGLGSLVGMFGGGMVVDRFGSVGVGVLMLCFQTLTYVALSVLAYIGPTGATTALLAIAIGI